MGELKYKSITTVLKDGLKEVTDHSMIELAVILDKSVSRILPKKVETCVT